MTNRELALKWWASIDMESKINAASKLPKILGRRATELTGREIQSIWHRNGLPSPLPETTKKVITKNGEVLPMNEAETEVMYKGEWCSIQEDQDGEFYFLSGGKVFYIEMPESGASIEELEKDLWNQPTGAPPTGKTETGVSVRDKWVARLNTMKENFATEFDLLPEGEVSLIEQMIANTAEMIRDFSPPPTPGNERQEGGDLICREYRGIFTIRKNFFDLNGTDVAEVTTNMPVSEQEEIGNELVKRYNSYPAMYRALKWMLKIAKGKLNENKKTIELRFEKDTLKTWAKDCEAIFNSITGGK